METEEDFNFEDFKKWLEAELLPSTNDWIQNKRNALRNSIRYTKNAEELFKNINKFNEAHKEDIKVDEDTIKDYLKEIKLERLDN